MVACTERVSHMWDSETCVAFLYEFVTTILAQQRKKLGVGREAKALFICDSAPVHLNRAFLQLRQNWCLENNAEIFGSDPEAHVTVPGGIGAVGAPNDAYHQFGHAARRYIERARMGYASNLADRHCLKLLVLSPSGLTHRRIDYKTAIENDCLAWEAVARYRKGLSLIHI